MSFVSKPFNLGRCIVLTGCSGAGKTTVINELHNRGRAIISEAGRQIVRSQLKSRGDALPWINPQTFVEQAIKLSIQQTKSTVEDTQHFPVFLDRSLIDLASYLEFCDLPVPYSLQNFIRENPYAKTVFVTPPWKGIFVSDQERRKTFKDAVEEYNRIIKTYKRLGYTMVKIPKTSVEDRADFIEKHISEAS